MAPIGRAAPLAQVAAKPGSAEHTGHEDDVNLAELRRVVLPDDGTDESTSAGRADRSPYHCRARGP